MLNWLSLALRISVLSVLAEVAWQEADPACFTTIAIKTCSGRPVRVLGCILKRTSTRKTYVLPLNNAGSIQNGLTHIGSVPCVATRYVMSSNVTSCHQTSLRVTMRHFMSSNVTPDQPKSHYVTESHHTARYVTASHTITPSSQHLNSLLPTFTGPPPNTCSPYSPHSLVPTPNT